MAQTDDDDLAVLVAAFALDRADVEVGLFAHLDQLDRGGDGVVGIDRADVLRALIHEDRARAGHGHAQGSGMQLFCGYCPCQRHGAGHQ